jgi:hypothetical protein
LDTAACGPFSHDRSGNKGARYGRPHLAGFEKILGYKDFTQEQLREIFWDNREDFEALASLLYEAHEGELLTITLTSAGKPADLEHRE